MDNIVKLKVSILKEKLKQAEQIFEKQKKQYESTVEDIEIQIEQLTDLTEEEFEKAFSVMDILGYKFQPNLSNLAPPMPKHPIREKNLPEIPNSKWYGSFEYLNKFN